MIEQLLGIPRGHFVECYLAKAPILTPTPVSPELLGMLPTLGDVAILAGQLGDLGDSLRHARAGDLTTYPAPRNPAGRADLESLWTMFAGGTSIVLNNLHKVHEGCRIACERLLFTLGHRPQANGYLTPAGSSAFTTHFDTHDVIVVQLSGSKTWRVYDRPEAVPELALRSDRRLYAEALEIGDPAVLTLRAGEAMYLPRGFPHRAEATEQISLHVTFGLVPVTLGEALKTMIDVAQGEQTALRRHVGADFLRAGGNEGGIEDQLLGLLRNLAEASFAARAVRALRKQTLQLAVLTPGLTEPSADPARPLRWRDDVFSEVQESGDDVVVTNGIKATRVSGEEVALFRRLLREPVDVAGLQPDVRNAFQALVRRLGAMGLVEAV